MRGGEELIHILEDCSVSQHLLELDLRFLPYSVVARYRVESREENQLHSS